MCVIKQDFAARTFCLHVVCVSWCGAESLDRNVTSVCVAKYHTKVKRVTTTTKDKVEGYSGYGRAEWNGPYIGRAGQGMYWQGRSWVVAGEGWAGYVWVRDVMGESRGEGRQGKIG